MMHESEQILKLDGKEFNLLEKCNLDELGLNSYQKEIIGFAFEWVKEEKIAFQTSGSTGTPKTIFFSKEECRSSAFQTIRFFNLQKSSNCWLCLPMRYVASKMMVIRAIVGGLNLWSSEPSICPILPNQSIHFAPLTPMIVSNLVDSKLIDRNTIQHILLGGGPAHSFLIEQLKTLGIKATASYGMTETLTHVAIKNLSPLTEDYFTMLEPCTFELDRDNKIVLHVPYIHNTPIYTNDIGQKIDKDSFALLGRADDMVNSGGVKINPLELEEKIRPHLTREVLFLGIPDQVLGEKLVLAVEGKKTEEFESLVNSIIRQELDGFEKPKEIFYLEEFLRTDSGKPKRSQISLLIQTLPI